MCVSSAFAMSSSDVGAYLCRRTAAKETPPTVLATLWNGPTIMHMPGNDMKRLSRFFI